MATTVAGALAVILLTGCSHGVVISAGPTKNDLRLALRAWAAFPVGASPRPLVLVGQYVDDPQAGFSSGAAKIAYLQRAIRFPAKLPSGPAASDGFRVISARRAVELFESGAATSPPGDSHLRVTTVRLGTGMFLTDRGPRRLPAWLFDFSGVHGPAAVLAVASRQIFTPRILSRGQPSPFVNWAYLGPSGRSLTVAFTGAAPGHGPCTASYSVRVAYSAAAVAVAVIGHPHGSGNQVCSAIGYLRRVSTELVSPLGPRVVVDAASRAAIAVTSRNAAG